MTGQRWYLNEGVGCKEEINCLRDSLSEAL